jgi:hypothetical protein
MSTEDEKLIPSDRPLGRKTPVLCFDHLDSVAVARLRDTALAAVLRDMQEKKNSSYVAHSSHSSYTAYSTYSMGPIG